MEKQAKVLLVAKVNAVVLLPMEWHTRFHYCRKIESKYNWMNASYLLWLIVDKFWLENNLSVRDKRKKENSMSVDILHSGLERKTQRLLTTNKTREVTYRIRIGIKLTILQRRVAGGGQKPCEKSKCIDMFILE